jgi:acid phosphatase type 7
VKLAGTAATSSGVPWATMRPPASPPSRPRSITRSAVLIRERRAPVDHREGTQATLAELLAAEAGAAVARNPADLREVGNYVTALEHGVSRLASLPVSLRLILELHARLMDGVRGGHATPGVFRRTQNWIGPVGCTLANATYVPPPPHEMMDALATGMPLSATSPAAGPVIPGSPAPRPPRLDLFQTGAILGGVTRDLATSRAPLAGGGRNVRVSARGHRASDAGPRGALRAVLRILALAVSALLLAAPGARSQTVFVGAAGDIACDPADANYNLGLGTASACRMKATSDLIAGGGFDVVLALGDTQYETGASGKFTASYDPTWGRFLAITRPVVGNHEYGIAGAAGYFGYFGAAAGDPAQGWYSFEAGAWHVVVLNSNCAAVGGCGPGSPQETWLRADLAAHSRVCTLAAWHHPRWSSGSHGSSAVADAFWRALHDAGADVILNGHDHDYERFAPLDPDGLPDDAHGIREFVVGTGGKNQTAFGTPRTGSEARSSGTFGVLQLSLQPGGYDWAFLPAAPGTFSDSGSGTCHATPRATEFVPINPCRLVDTRNAAGPSGGPSLQAGATRDFPVASLCGVPATALAVAMNVTALRATSAAEIRIGEGGLPVPEGGAVVYVAPGATRAGNTVGRLGARGRLAVAAVMPGGSVDVVIDVNGYFVPPATN